ncbi:MAG TPA: phosphatidylserine/phosphatidylglycerophosphate/cardiolipin synthase family protein [Kofleriaceae bacterium]|nr:phosphatidylserine/phosphatidylglycerophosphate/cardiolipin synthase family protein [Kofleriaceae bacterium]
MRLSSPRALLFGLACLLAACADEPTAFDVCDQAAEHRAECVGEYVTPPVCDADAEAAAEYLLTLSCDEIAQLGQDGKADGAFCDWFGAGCTPDESIFTGGSCTTAAQCASGSSCLEGHCFAGTDSAEFTALMDTWTKSAETSGGSAELLADNAQTRVLRNQLMANAQHSIHFTALLIEDDETGRETVALMADAARRGVEVRVVVDATTQYTFSSYDVLRPLVEAGGEILPYNPVTEWAVVRWKIGININQRLHEKLLIVDGTDAVVGGRNVGDDYLLAGHWHDTCVHLRGPGVTDVQRIFLALWDQLGAWENEAGCPQRDKYGFACPAHAIAAEAAYTPALAPVAAARTRPIYSDPRSQKPPMGYLAYLNLVRTAHDSIYIANSYFVPPRRLRKHLKAAVARGVRVVVLTNSLQSTDAWWMYYASLNYYKELIGAGIEVHQYRGTETMHAKTMLVDGKLAVIGSFNLDPRSAASNSEALVVVRDGAAVGELAQDFSAMLAYSDLASAEISAADWVKAKAFKLVEPLL